MRNAFALCLISAALGCAAPDTVFEATSRSPEFRGRHFTTVAFLSLSDDPALRKIFGDSVVGYLRTWTARSEKGSDLLPRTAYDSDGDGHIDLDGDKDIIRKRLFEAGFQAILTAHYEPKEPAEPNVDAHAWSGESFSGHWAGEIGKEHTGEPPAEFLIETELYDALTGRVVWYGHSRTVRAANAVTLAESYASAVVNELVRNGLVTKR